MEVLFAGNNLLRLLQGLGVSFSIALVAIACSIVIGIVVGFMMLSRFMILRIACKLYLESVRIIPILALLYVCYFGLPQLLHISLSNIAVAVLVFSFWGGAEMADLVRGALSSVDKHQRESALSLGLSPLQAQIFIILPIASKRLLPGLINLFTRMIKTTALLLFIGIADMLQVGRQIIEANRSIPTAAFSVYGALLVGYFAMCFPLSRLAKSLENRAKA
ncbi:amino acid ABC transporter permease [Helicobacter zhangjianzhongii]|uniref:Amino acid ABC transporter permease n=1 Tax=Helicobacter zhangjianzhongii TaxID=2974574 RepID=A0ACC6FRD8_9HELI|nr:MULTISPECIES: amino acid ABC transporter permease [unclassified Helicobacter]MDL0080057.1 amino acid ABC transporter permease [Helicobacter sp. CPD2-1]MDL0081846.1 amino acid ABC transporter permease [Helicobacter sp. XJK30-2]